MIRRGKEVMLRKASFIVLMGMMAFFGFTLVTADPASTEETLQVEQTDTPQRSQLASQAGEIGIDEHTLPNRPTDPDGGQDGLQHILPTLYQTTHFVIHYTNGTDGGDPSDAPDLTDANSNGTPDYIEDFASYFETSYDFEVTTRGFNSPPSDDAAPDDANNRNPNAKYDVFVYDLGEHLFGVTYPEQAPSIPSYSYIDVNKDYDWTRPNDDPEGSAKGAMKVTAAREFHRAIQFTYDFDQPWWHETTAVYMEDEVYPEVNHNYNELAGWFEWCDTYGLEHEEQMYGNFIWAKWLSEQFEDEIIREIWEENQVTDGLAAIDNVLATHGSSVVSEFNKFTTANYFLEDMYEDGADYRAAVTGSTEFDGVWLEYQYDEATDGLPFTIDSSNVNDKAWMDRWAADYVTIEMSGATPSYRITFDGLDLTTHYDVSLVTKAGGDITPRDFALDTSKDGTLELAYDAAYTDVVIIIRNSGNTDTANPSWVVTISSKSAPPPSGGGGGGGGGGGPQPSGPELAVDMMGRVSSVPMTEDGVLEETISVTSRDGVVMLRLAEGTAALDSEGNRLEEITMDAVADAPEVPENAHIIGLAYDFGPDGATFEPPIDLTIRYAPEELPEEVDEEDLGIAYYDEDRGEWVVLSSEVDTAANTVTAPISHTTVFAILGKILPPQFTLANLIISPEEVSSGEDVVISVRVANNGGSTGSRMLELRIDGALEASQEATLAPGAGDTVTFTVTRDEAGTYGVTVDGLSGSFTVTKEEFPWWVVWLGVGLGALLLAAITTYLLIWRRSRATA